MMKQDRVAPRSSARALWFQVHKWIGLLLAILIIPISLTGSALVWHDWLDETLNPVRYERIGTAALPASAYADASRAALKGGERVATMTFSDEGLPVMVGAPRAPEPGATGRPVRTNLWLDPRDGRVVDQAASNEGAVRVLHVLHGSLMVPGVGRQIVGWIGVAMLISCISGLWIWWPKFGGIAKGLRWRRQNSTNANLHHQAGFWILIPLAMLSFTGVWISFPGVFSQFNATAPAPKGAGEDRARQQRARPLEATVLTPDQAIALARPLSPGALRTVTWPTDQSPDWTLSFAREGGPAEVKVNDATSALTPPKPVQPETLARNMRRWHDGTGMGLIWQVIIFVGGIIPALLGVTGILMWLRSRGWRGEVARRKRERAAVQAAE